MTGTRTSRSGGRRWRNGRECCWPWGVPHPNCMVDGLLLPRRPSSLKTDPPMQTGSSIWAERVIKTELSHSRPTACTEAAVVTGRSTVSASLDRRTAKTGYSTTPWPPLCGERPVAS